jgi:hypothetical protein
MLKRKLLFLVSLFALLAFQGQSKAEMPSTLPSFGAGFPSTLPSYGAGFPSTLPSYGGYPSFGASVRVRVR